MSSAVIIRACLTAILSGNYNGEIGVITGGMILLREFNDVLLALGHALRN